MRRQRPNSITNMWKNQRASSARNRRSGGGRQQQQQQQGQPVGTEAKALANLKANRHNFQYPPEGFVTKIEYSLLYAMISEPDTYPQEVVKEMVDEEDFTQYLTIDATTTTTAVTAEEQEGEEEERVSYAQLAALLSLSAEKNPSEDNESPTTKDGKERNSIPQTLCKRILQTVINYAEEHELDRETELQELLLPVKKVANLRAAKAEWKVAMPLYIGYTASILTGNPLPLLVGAVAVTAAAEDNSNEYENVKSIVSTTDRAGDAERTGLLDYHEER